VQLLTYFDVIILTILSGLMLFLIFITYIGYLMMIVVLRKAGVLPVCSSMTQKLIRSLNRKLSYLLMSLMNGKLSLRKKNSLGLEYPAGKQKLVWVEVLNGAHG
jgi:hypothetical protein